jgi:hypothetical protein
VIERNNKSASEYINPEVRISPALYDADVEDFIPLGAADTLLWRSPIAFCSDYISQEDNYQQMELIQQNLADLASMPQEKSTSTTTAAWLLETQGIIRDMQIDHCSESLPVRENKLSIARGLLNKLRGFRITV